jgi:hypothetical protein
MPRSIRAPRALLQISPVQFARTSAKIYLDCHAYFTATMGGVRFGTSQVRGRDDD